MSYRIRPQDITPRGSSPFMTPHGARVTAPLDEVLTSEELFTGVRSNLRAGDQVLLCRYENGEWNKARILEYVEVMITQSTPKAVEFEAMGPVRVIGEAKPELEPETTEPQLTELEIVDNPQGGFLAREVVSGHVQKHFKTKAAAERYLRDYGGPAKAA
jgi:hypothetical protein